jgi:hypothetical protein
LEAVDDAGDSERLLGRIGSHLAQGLFAELELEAQFGGAVAQLQDLGLAFGVAQSELQDLLVEVVLGVRELGL